MKVLHLCTDFARQKLYSQLVSALSTYGIEQSVYVPVRTKQEVNQNRDLSIINVRWQFSFILNLLLKFHYHRKIQVVLKDLESTLGFNADLIHAHFLFSDGGVAYELFKRKRIPYIVCVRNTDLNSFFKYAFHLRIYGLKILQHAEHIIFVTPSYRKQILSYIPNHLHASLIKKSIIIPNGVNEFWHRNILTRPAASLSGVWKILYVGEFSLNKNIPKLIESVLVLRKANVNVTLTLVGEYGDYVETIKKIVSKHHQWLKSMPKVDNTDQLKNLYRSHHIFAMPSLKETFGLVYIEALTQKLPIIYSANQGVDGYFSEEYGVAVKADDINSITEGLHRVIDKYHSMVTSSFNLERFRWNNVAKEYMNIYEQLLKNKV